MITTYINNDGGRGVVVTSILELNLDLSVQPVKVFSRGKPVYIRKITRIYSVVALLVTFVAYPSNALASNTLEVGVLVTTGEQRALFTSLAQAFENDNPGVTVKLIAKNDADYKASIDTWLTQGDGPDLFNWQGGERLYQYVREGRVEPLSDFWEQHDLASSFSQGSVSAVSLDGERYALPISYYQWGFFYRKSLFKTLNISTPETWEDFLYVCAVLKREGITPITIGNKNSWPSAAWFDYLNLRLNGLKFHQDLLLGKESFKDPRVVQVFEYWKNLIDRQYFVHKQKDWDWKAGMPFLYHKMAGMTLIGNFFSGQLPEMLKDDFGFFRFPVINKNIPIYEEAPLDLFMLPRYSDNKPLAKKFLLAVADAGFQETFNEAQGMISPNTTSRSSADYFIRSGAEVLNAAEGLSQFFDRDTNSDMAAVAVKIFSAFIENPDISRATTGLEVAREQHLVRD